jgi:hypothetical protein
VAARAGLAGPRGRRARGFPRGLPAARPGHPSQRHAGGPARQALGLSQSLKACLQLSKGERIFDIYHHPAMQALLSSGAPWSTDERALFLFGSHDGFELSQQKSIAVFWVSPINVDPSNRTIPGIAVPAVIPPLRLKNFAPLLHVSWVGRRRPVWPPPVVARLVGLGGLGGAADGGGQRTGGGAGRGATRASAAGRRRAAGNKGASRGPRAAGSRVPPTHAPTGAAPAPRAPPSPRLRAHAPPSVAGRVVEVLARDDARHAVCGVHHQQVAQVEAHERLLIGGESGGRLGFVRADWGSGRARGGSAVGGGRGLLA